MQSPSVYSKDDLEKIMSACFVMAVVDGHIDEKEIEAIFAFMEKHWQGAYGDLKELARSANDRAFDILGSGKSRSQLEEKAESLAGTLDASQKEGVLSLLAAVMTADGQEGKRETGMFKIFLSRLYDPDAISRDGMKRIISVLLV